jgi:hypothetical protein
MVTKMIRRGAQVVRVLGLLLDRNQRWTRVAKAREALFVEKRKERLYGVIQWDPETGGLLSQDGNRVLLFFFYCQRAEVTLWHEPTFLGKEKYLPGELSPFRTSCSLPFSESHPIINEWGVARAVPRPVRVVSETQYGQSEMQY